MFTVLAGVLMVMTPGVGPMFMSMGMLVLMFMLVGLGRSMRVFMTMEVLMGMRAFHRWCSFRMVTKYYHPFSSMETQRHRSF
jgi:hypothetical protein